MSPRLVKWVGLAAIVVAVVVIAFLRVVRGPVADQSQVRTAQAGAAAKGAAALKTPWGDPDLQGIWTDEYEIPLQRPAQYANKEFLTDAEMAASDQQRAAAPRVGDVGVAPRGSEEDVANSYNAVFYSTRHTGRRTSLIVDPPDGRIPSVTPEVTKRRAEIRQFQLALLQATEACKNKQPACAGGKYGPPSPRQAEAPPSYLAAGGINRANGPEDRTMGERCMGAQLPDFAYLTVILKYYRIVQSPESVSIHYDTAQGESWPRVIPLSGGPHIPTSIRQRFGDSRGHWEGRTLVVDVTNFSPKSDFQGSRENLHLVERWTRTDAKTLEYVVTMDDPTTWTKPWTVKQEMNRQDEEANRIYYEPRCHEGNYGLVGMLLGARANEKAFAAGRGPNPFTMCINGCGGTGLGNPFP